MADEASPTHNPDEERILMQESKQPIGGITGVAFALVVTLGGTNFIAVRFSNQELDPFFGAGLRFSIAAVLFVLICLVLRVHWPRGRQLNLAVLAGVLSFAASYALMYWALLQVTAGVATVVLALVPLVTILLTAAQHLERLRASALVGSLLALAGIAWIMASPSEIVLPWTALLAMIGAAVCIGQGVIVTKKVAGNHPAVINAIGMITGAVLLLVLSALVGETWALPKQPEVRLALLYLVTLGSVGLFLLVLLVIRRWTASATSYMFVLFPLVTMLLDALISDVPITVSGVTGAVLVMAGVWFGALAPSARHPAPPPPDRIALESN
jgi:drug/metabolite transporter (DMT)-like permease